MQYQLDYTVYRNYESCPGVYERERGTVEFADAITAQEFCESPVKMLEWFGADSGKFELRGGERPFEWDWIWSLEYDLQADMNRLPIGYRIFRDAIFAVEG